MRRVRVHPLPAELLVEETADDARGRIELDPVEAVLQPVVAAPQTARELGPASAGPEAVGAIAERWEVLGQENKLAQMAALVVERGMAVRIGVAERVVLRRPRASGQRVVQDVDLARDDGAGRNIHQLEGALEQLSRQADPRPAVDRARHALRGRAGLAARPPVERPAGRLSRAGARPHDGVARPVQRIEDDQVVAVVRQPDLVGDAVGALGDTSCARAAAR